METFSSNLLIQLNQKSLTYREFSEITGISIAAIASYISRKRQPTLSAIKKICYALKVSPNYLLGFEENEALPWENMDKRLKRIENILTVNQEILGGVLRENENIDTMKIKDSIQIKNYMIILNKQTIFKNDDIVLIEHRIRKEIFFCRTEVWVYGYKLYPLNKKRKSITVDPEFSLYNCYGRILGVFKKY